MNYLIIIRGPLGIGKTTIAKKLAKLLNADYISIDETLSKNNLDKIDKKLGCISESNFLKANKIISPDILKNNKSVVVDGNFYYKNQIEDLINKISFKSFVFTLTAPLEVCVERDFKRPNSYGKEAVIAVYNLVSKINYGEIIDTSTITIKKIIKIILTKPLYFKYKLELDVQEPFLSFIKSGQKKVEGRLAKDKYLKLKPGDLIKINDINVEVIKVSKYSSFENMLISEGTEKVIPNAKNLKEAIDVYYGFYSKEDETKFGVVGITIKLQP